MRKQTTSILLLLSILLFTACGGGGDESSSATVKIPFDITDSTQTTPKIASKYYGKWSYVHDGSEVNLLTTTDLDITEVPDDENLLKVHKDNTIYYLVRSSIAKTTITGKIEVDTTSLIPGREASSFSAIGNINIILSHILDSRINEETKTNSDGSFTTTTLPSGIYKIKASDASKEFETQIVIENEANDIGVYKLTGSELNNFKAELIINSDYIISNGQVHEAILRVHNISNNIGYGLTYDISLDNTTNMKSFTEGSIDALGSVTAKGYKDIPIGFSFNTLSTNMQQYGVDVTIKDALGNQWIDTFKFNVNKALIAVIIATKSSAVKGYIKNPLTGNMTKIDTADGKIFVPLMPEDKPYLLMLSNSSLSSETAYSLGVNTLPDDFATFKNTAAYEPDNIESKATALYSDSTATSYLHSTDIDFWKIYTNEGTVVDKTLNSFTNSEAPTSPSTAPVGLSATDGTYSDKIEISWSDTSSATYYELYQSASQTGIYTKISSVSIKSYSDTTAITNNTYYYKVRGCNNTGCSEYSNINSGYLFITNKVPIANAGIDKTISEGNIVTLDASSSTDYNGSIVSYEWKENSTILS